MRWGAALLIVLWELAGTQALAHAVVEGVEGFRGGFLHPLLVPAHALALVALGLMAGCTGSMRRGVLLAAFAAGLAAAVVTVAAAYAVFDADIYMLAAAAAAALAAAARWDVPPALAVPLTASAGAALLLDSVPRLISVSETLLALAGTALGAWCAYAVVATQTAAFAHPWFRFGARILASWIAASALLVLALRLAPR